ncbi:peptidoglycan-binding protein [Streptomyces sp. NPDC051243]|uniref:peptidoglycan-binding protein n=1 Tax=Streptomyces sp. NPDC051243 TaxID=3365646 RepID=UPI0037B5ABC6
MSESRGTAGAEGQDDPGRPTDRRCPECGTPRTADNTPSCGCGPRASEALRDARTAEAAAAEDFDPLRIRPYVELEGGTDETMPLRPVPPVAPPPSPLSPPPAAPSARDLSLFEPATGSHDGAHEVADPRQTRRHRRTALLGAGGALVAVLAAAGLASGMLSYEKPTRDTALPDEVRPSIPAAPSTSEAPREPSPGGRSTPSGPPAASATASAPSPTTQSASPSPSRSSASPTPPRSTQPTTAPSSARPTPQEESAALETTPPTLRRGDRGPEVTELELRLTQLGLYTREARGNFNEGVEDAVARYQWARGVQVEEYGVYDVATRESLESETSEP